MTSGFGNLISNSQLIRLCEEKKIEIRPFEKERSQLAHYPLDPEVILVREGERWVTAHNFRLQPEPFNLSPRQYVIVEIRQRIVVAEGYVGLFVPASNLIERGLGITAGKIAYPFGQLNEQIRFGLKNHLDEPNVVKVEDLMAYVQFFDLSKSHAKPYNLSARDQEIYQKRRAIAADDGPWAVAAPDAPI